MSASSIERRNFKTGLWLTAVVLGMFGFGYALVPLYDAFCEFAGINGKGIRVEVVDEAPAPATGIVDASREVRVEFTGAIMGGLPWEFEAAKTVTVHPGETVRIFYTARNLSSSAVVGQAVPSIAPNKATRFFVKTECFCFQNQRLAPGEAKDMPLAFRVDPDLPPTVHTITLSYAFYRAGAAPAWSG